MFDTVKMLIESSALPEVDFITENTNNFNMIREATENEILCTKFNPKKIPVIQYDGKYVIEFADGVDKLMKEQNIGLDEAMNTIAAVNGIQVTECVLIVDESAINMIDLSGLSFKMYDVARK